jgi:hypothetical protein
MADPLTPEETQLFKTEEVTGSLVRPAAETYSHNAGAVETNPPKASYLGDVAAAGESMVSNIARGVQSYNIKGKTIATGINFANRNQHHICEPVGIAQPKRRTITTMDGIEVPNLALGSPALELSILFKSAEVQKFLSDLRKSIEDAFSVTGGPLLDTIKNAAKYILEKIREINRIIKTYVVLALLIVQVEQWVSLLLKFIASLPKIFADAFAECVVALKNAIQNALTFAILPQDNTARLLKEISNLQKNLTLAEQATQAVVAGFEQIQLDVENLSSGIDLATDTLTSVFSNVKNNPPKPVVNVSLF